MKFVEFADNCRKFTELANNSWDSQRTSMKFQEAANNFTKFIGVTNKFWKIRNTRKSFIKYVD